MTLNNQNSPSKGKAMYLCLLGAVISAIYCGCTSDFKTNPSSVVETDAKIISSQPATRWVAKKLGDQENLASVQFINQAYGWVVSRGGKIYSTSDGGVTWKQKRLNMPLNAEVSASFFIDSLTGWITAVRMSPDVLEPGETRSWVMRTEDGGDTWLTQYSQEALQLNRLFFVTAQEGWAIGSRRVRRDTLQNDLFVLHSDDAGKHWTIISESLPEGAGFLEDAYYDKSLGLVVLNSEGHMFSTADRGAKWLMQAEVPDEPSQTFFGRLGQLADKRLWVLGGTSGFEGTYGVLAFKNSGNTWIKIKTRAYLNDVIFLSNEKVVACGFVNEESGTHAGKRGVILRSSNGGRSWSSEYPTNSNAVLKALARAGNHLWVIGEDGYIAVLEDF